MYGVITHSAVRDGTTARTRTTTGSMRTSTFATTAANCTGGTCIMMQFEHYSEHGVCTEFLIKTIIYFPKLKVIEKGDQGRPYKRRIQDINFSWCAANIRTALKKI